MDRAEELLNLYGLLNKQCVEWEDNYESDPDNERLRGKIIGIKLAIDKLEELMYHK